MSNLRQAVGEMLQRLPAVGMLSSPVMPATVLCALLCCLCGYLAFRMLQSQELSTAASFAEPISETKPGRQQQQQQQQGGALSSEAKEKRTSHAPNTPSASPQPLLKPALDSEDGNSSVLIERISSTQLPEGVQVEHTLLSTGASFRVLGTGPTDRGPLVAEVPDGERNYVWDDGSEYFGEWKDGVAQGRGVFSWPSGSRYEGEWEHGKENGVGTFISVDGSTFYGFWADGKMHGEGVYKPATAQNQRAEVMFMREYHQGKLVKETVLRVKDYDLHRKELKRDQRAWKVEKKQAAKDLAAPRPGETIYKGHRSYDLMRNLQMGILFSIAKTNREASERAAEPGPIDYRSEVTQQFPRSGQSTSFKWKDYCPLIFHQLRQAFGIDNRDYLLSLTGDKALRELPSPGKSGSVFFISDDDRFMIKTVRKEEMRLLLELVPKYYAHCLENPDTLLTRFYGVHRVKPINGHHVRFLVMGNVFPTETRLHQKYDLKGSTYGRTAGLKRSDPNATLKDLDVDFRLELRDTYYKQLMAQIEADAALLERMHVMDYSLLLGIHFVTPDDPWYPAPGAGSKEDEVEEGDSPAAGSGHRLHVTWDEPRGARVSNAENTLFTRWHSQRQTRPDEPGVPSEGVRDSRGVTHPSNSELEPPSAASSMTSTSMASTAGAPSGFQRPASAMEGSGRSGLEIRLPSSSWPASSPQRPSRFALQSRAEAESGTGRPDPNPFQRASEQPYPLIRDSTARASSVELSEQSNRVLERVSFAETSRPDEEGAARSRSGTLQAEGNRSPKFLQLLNRVRVRDDQEGMGKACLDRSRSGWLRGGNEGTSLRSLHSEARRHMGVSIPAMVHPLRANKTVDVEGAARPVTLFFGIIDFLQDYNMRKRTEHVLKSIVQDGKAISVTNPHTYSQRFTRFMHNLFITVPTE